MDYKRVHFQGKQFPHFVSPLNLSRGYLLTLLHSEGSKLHRVLGVLSAIGLKRKSYYPKTNPFL